MNAVSLPARRLFALPAGAAVHVRCTAGSLWLTLDHDPRDIVLAAGDSFTTPGNRRALVYALEPAAFVLGTRQPPERAAAWRRLIAWLLQDSGRRPTRVSAAAD